MNLARRICRRLGNLLRRSRREADMAEEMRFHLEQRAAEFASDGLSLDESRQAAERRFGNIASLQEQSRETRGWGLLERFAKDARFAVRQLVRSPGFSLLAILTLGLGIGANTSMFSLLNAVVRKPLPYADLPQLEHVYRVTPQSNNGPVSAADFATLGEEQEAYGEFGAYALDRVSLASASSPAQVAFEARTTTNLFTLLGVKPQLGRDFRADEITPGKHRVVILSQRTWRSQYGGQADIIGRTVRIDGEPHQVIGVLPPSFNDWRHLGNIDFFRPFAFTPEFLSDHERTMLWVIGRRATTVTAADGAGMVASVGARLAQEFPGANADSSWRTVPLQSTAGLGGETVLPMLVGLSGLVLLIACSNLANLLLARTMERAREYGVRAALGASRLQLLRPLMIESLLLSLAGGLLAIVIAHWFRDWAAVRSTGDNGEQVDFVVNRSVLAWAFIASMATAGAFGVAPAIFALRLNVNETLKSGGRGFTSSRGHHRFRRLLIVGQFALAMVLLAGAALFIRGLHDLHHRRIGWQSAQLVSGALVLPSATYDDAAKILAFQRLLLERLSTLPGVASACLSAESPVFHWTDTRRFLIEGQSLPTPGREPAAVVNLVSPGYFTTYGTRILSGRDFAESDSTTSGRAFLISQATAQAWFTNEDPLGCRLALVGQAGEPVWGEIVGIVANVRPSDADRNPITTCVYLPIAQDVARQFEFAVQARAGVAPSSLVDGIRHSLTAIDGDLPVRRLRPTEQTISRALYQLGVLRDVLFALGTLGLGLASIGIYGVIARTTAQRTSEIAIRLALGASVRDITRLVLGSGIRLALTGAVLGLFGAFGVSRILTSAFPGMQANSTAVLAGTTVLLAAVAILASWLPARHATKIDPVTALRAD